MAREEQRQIRIWAKAISQKAELVKYTEHLFNNLRQKERLYVNLWAQAIKRLGTAGDNEDITFYTEVVSGNQDIPVLVTDEDGNITASKNLDSYYESLKVLSETDRKKFTRYEPIKVNYYEDRVNYIYYRNSALYYRLKQTLDDYTKLFLNEVVKNSLSTPVLITDSTHLRVLSFGGNVDSSAIKDSLHLAELISVMEEDNTPIIVDLPGSPHSYIFYEDSQLFTEMKWFPTIFFFVISLFLMLSYTLFSFSRRSEQSKVWAGMAKETAHQLGTPISSLMGWIEVLKMKYPDEKAFPEMDKDIKRLTLVSERFSKIGSEPDFSDEDPVAIIESVISYMQARTAKRIEYIFINNLNQQRFIKMNRQLMIWVFENLYRNAVDAIGSHKGKIKTFITETDNELIIDVSDTGKGIAKAKQKAVFNPGYSTKKRGWGLGLSLVKRIIIEQHRGKIFVKASAPGEGTTFRIIFHK
jgi:signal transduction histidine kinase